MNPAAAGDGGGDAAAWTATEERGDEEEIRRRARTLPCLGLPHHNMILCVMMAATGAIGIKNMRYASLGDLVPLYIIALAALWFVTVNTIRPCPPITGLYKRNFGFFYAHEAAFFHIHGAPLFWCRLPLCHHGPRRSG